MSNYEEVFAEALGNKERNFREEPLTLEEIEALIITIHKEREAPNISPELAAFFDKCLEVLRSNVTYN